jgi:proline dehydrogenase
LDFDPQKCYSNVKKIVTHAKDVGNYVWIDMEDTRYTDRTIQTFRELRSEFTNVGVCLQSYLMRTADDLKQLMTLPSSIRLVKGCYAESANVAYAKKSDVDESFFKLAMQMILAPEKERSRIGIATHDPKLAARIQSEMNAHQIPKDRIEFQMLYGIRSADQARLRKEGYPVRCLISYGSYWFPWYMRRLAERPANVLFVLRNLFET